MREGLKKTLPLFIFLFAIFLIAIFAFFINNKKEVPEKEIQGNDGENVVVPPDFGLDEGNTILIEYQNELGAEEVEELEENRDDRVIINDKETDTVALQEEQSEPLLERLFKKDVAGYRVEEDGEGFLISLVEKGKGNRYKITTNDYSLEKIKEGEFTKVKEALIFKNGETLIIYEDSIDELTRNSAFISFDGDNKNIRDFEKNIRAIQNDENLLFFTRALKNGVVGIVVDVEKPQDTRVIWESDFKNWNFEWTDGKYILIQTPISKYTEAHSYLIDSEGVERERKIFNHKGGGGVFIDTTSSYILEYRGNKNQALGKSYIRDIDRDKEFSIPVILPEKCDGFNGIFACAIANNIKGTTLSGFRTIFPDSWYQGDLVFSDSVILIDALTEKAEVVFSINQERYFELTAGETFDIIKPKLSSDGRYLFFINKINGSLWKLKLF